MVNGTITYTGTPVDPETRTLNTSTYLVGATNGSLNVNPMGGSAYTVPLELLPGVNGLSPGLSLEYSSNRGPGIAGYGWHIGGLSSISRGPQTYYHDGSAKGVNLDNNDRFYLDGLRLVNTSYTYGDANAQYQTDNDIFTRVTPQVTDTYGPGWFKAETKSGLILEYGNSTGSKQKITGFSQTVNWYVSKISDLFGNLMNFAYIQDNLSVYPAEITYGPNTITFYYKERTDKTYSFLKGIKIEQNLLLDKIVIKYNTAIVKTHEFKYTYQGSQYNYYSTLNEIIEYGTGTSRINSTAITYQVPANVSFSQTTYNTTHEYVTYKSRLTPGDYDGDGKTDFLCLPDPAKGATWTGLKVYFSDGNDIFTSNFSQAISIPVSTLRDIRSLDINGDGRDDILYEEGSGTSLTTFKYMVSNGNSFTTPVIITTYPNVSTAAGLSGKRNRIGFKQDDDNERKVLIPVSPNVYALSSLSNSRIQSSEAADYNGDGVNDIFTNNKDGNWKIYSFVNSYGQKTSYLNPLASGTIATLVNEVLSGDFNGDGKADLWSFEDIGVKIYTFTGSSLSILYNSTWPSKKHFFNPGDFNADGKVDVFLYGYGRDATEYDWSEWQIQLSTGIGFTPVYFPKKKNNLKDDYVRLGDFNGDGVTDVMATSMDLSWNGAWFYISKNYGTDFYSYNIPNYPIASHNFYVSDFDGDARTDFICTDGQYEWWNGYQVYKTVGNTSILMEKVGNGLGVLTKVTYTKLSQASSGNYQRGSGAAYPVSDFQGPWSVVTSVQYDNGKGSLNTQNYYYEGVKIHLQGKGFLGFTKTRISDIASGIDNESVITSGFNTLYFYPQVYLTLKKRSNTTDTLEKTKNTLSQKILDPSKKWIFPYVQVSTQTNKLTGQSVIVNSTYDNYGNPTSIVKNYSNGPVESTFRVYNNTVSSSLWLLGRPTSDTIKYLGGGTTITRSGTKTFSSSSNNLTYEKWHSGTNNQFERGFKYNSNGTLKRDSISANGSWRTTVYTYETNNIRIKTIRDPLSHTDSLTYDSYGRLQKKKDYLNNTLNYQYDAMGRLAGISSSDGYQTTTEYDWETPTSVPKPARYSVQKTGNDGSQSKSWFDKLGREIRSDVKGFNGTWIYTAAKYNLKGQADSVSEPYYSNETPLWNRYQYDYYGRITNLTRPSGRNSSWAYSNNVITETTGGKSFTKTYSSNGTLSSAQDAGGTINYVYYPDGKIKTISAPGNIITQMEYDIAGNQKKLIDPSAGTINYTYNGYGELVTQQNARSQTTTIFYNANGTIKQKETPEGLIKYRYNTNKQLVNVNSYGTVSHTYGYDSKGRVISVIDTIPGTTPLTTSFNYDSYGRMSTITHPSGITETYNYNVNGYLSSISAGGSTRWTTTSVNARQQVTAGQYGSDLSATYGFDAYGYPTSTVTGSLQSYSYNFNTVTGNLNWRQNNKYSNLKETFNYDNSDRLDNVYLGTGTPVLTLDMAYDSNKGGITTKSDAGTMIYNSPGKPYALGGICPTTGLVPQNTQSVTCTSFESVSTISENNYVASFTYNPEAQRAKMVVQQSSNTILTRWYSGSSYTKETAGGVTKQYTFIGGDAYTAPVVAVKTGTGTPVYYYLLRDYLGSITHVVNTSKTLVAEYSYDAWGRMRNPTNWTNYAPGTEPALFVAGRGFTGHEHMPWFNSINMNGRIYDPLIGQFLSPDNYVQSPDFTQNLNRYSYCLNNPLAYTDPSGEFIFSLFLGPVGAIIDAACWSAAIDAGFQGFRIATGKQDNFNWAELGGAAVGGAVGGAFAAAAPAFTQTNLFVRYSTKALYAGLSGAAGAGAGMLGTDLFDNGQIDYSAKDYLKGMALGGGLSMGISLGGSAYNYGTWDKYSDIEKLDILKKEFGNNIELNNGIYTSDGEKIIAGRRFNKAMTAKVGDRFIASEPLAYKSTARSALLHEMIHDMDLNVQMYKVIFGKNDALSLLDYFDYTERNAYYYQLLQTSKNTPGWWWSQTANYARSWGANIPKTYRVWQLIYNLF